MKTVLLQEKLKEGLSAIERISSRSFSLPSLNNVLIRAVKNFICLEATNLEIGLKWWILAKTEKEGEIAVPSGLFSNFISLLPNEKLELESAETNLKIKHGAQITKVRGFSSEDFPVIPQVKENGAVLFENKPFCEGLGQVIGIPSLSTSRPEISGIRFLLQKNQAIIAATDSFRLGEKKISFENSQKGEVSFILPQKTAREVINIFGEKEGTLKLYFSSNQVMFEFLMTEPLHPKIQLVSRLVEGEYPNYQEIIPTRFETRALLKRDEFMEQIKLASLFGKKTNEVRLKVDVNGQKIEIFSQSPDLGEYGSQLSGEIKGSGLEMSFNYKFLLDGLLSIKSQEVFFGLSGKDGAGILKPNNAEDYIYIVMPMKSG